jgi:hypothetical protein
LQQERLGVKDEVLVCLLLSSTSYDYSCSSRATSIAAPHLKHQLPL